MTAFPTPFTVAQAVFTGTGEDALGNDVETWADQVNVRVICWGASSVESLASTGGGGLAVNYTSRVVADIDLAVPPDLAVSVQDRFILPGEPGVFEVTAIEDANHGFHQWRPGSIVKLRRVSG